MFNNIGGKIKGLAKGVTAVGVIVSVVIAVALFATEMELLIGIGLAVGILGSLLSWISSLVLYGFGQLVENSDKLASGGRSAAQSETPCESAPVGIEARLQELEKWRQDGVITEEEYGRKKGAMIGEFVRSVNR